MKGGGGFFSDSPVSQLTPIAREVWFQARGVERAAEALEASTRFDPLSPQEIAYDRRELHRSVERLGGLIEAMENE